MKYFFLFISLLFANFYTIEAYANKCRPNNPNGVQENTLCIKHYINKIKKAHVDFGRGIYSHHGLSLDPLKPESGTYFQDKRFSNNEFYTKVGAGDESNGIIVETNKGRVFSKRQ